MHSPSKRRSVLERETTDIVGKLIGWLVLTGGGNRTGNEHDAMNIPHCTHSSAPWNCWPGAGVAHVVEAAFQDKPMGAESSGAHRDRRHPHQPLHHADHGAAPMHIVRRAPTTTRTCAHTTIAGCSPPSTAVSTPSFR